MNEPVRIRREIIERMEKHARAEAPAECCGLLGGSHGRISEIFPAKNALASPRAYEIAPNELFGIFREMRSKGLEHLGIYHSHPHSENAPSPTDIAGAFYRETPYFIISLLPNAPHLVRAFLIREGAVTELSIVLE